MGLTEAFVGTASKLDFSLCRDLPPLPPFHRCFSQDHILNILHFNLYL